MSVTKNNLLEIIVDDLTTNEWKKLIKFYLFKSLIDQPPIYENEILQYEDID